MWGARDCNGVVRCVEELMDAAEQAQRALQQEEQLHEHLSGASAAGGVPRGGSPLREARLHHHLNHLLGAPEV